MFSRFQRTVCVESSPVTQGTVNAKITSSDFAAVPKKGRKKPALSGRAKINIAHSTGGRFSVLR